MERTTNADNDSKQTSPPEALEVGHELEHEKTVYRVVEVDQATWSERRYRVESVDEPDSSLWMRQRSVGARGGFAAEANFLKRLHQARRVHLFPRVVDHFDDETVETLIVERVFGRSIREVADELRDDPNEMALCFEQMLLAVSKVHRAGWVLTDLCPDSFVRAESGRVQLIEMTRMTRRGVAPEVVVAGPYAAPELDTAQPVDERVDLFSIGCLVAGLIFDQDFDANDRVARLVEEKRLVRPVMTQLLRGSITDREDRFLSVDEMRILIYQLKNELSLFPRPSVAMSSTVGVSRHRYINEDSAGFQEVGVQYQSRPQHLGFYCVADGMGGHELGERASQLSVLGALQAFSGISQEIPFDQLQERLAGFALTIGRAASEIVCSGAAQFPGGARMGTTFTGVFVLNDELAVAHVGDSRASLVRDGEVTALTLDHSLVASLVRVGQMTEEEAAVSEDKNVLVRCIDARVPMDESGFDSLAAAGFEDGRLTMKAGDRVIIVSDGVWGVLDDETMLALAVESDQPQEISNLIVNAALNTGSNDNATAMVLVWS